MTRSPSTSFPRWNCYTCSTTASQLRLAWPASRANGEGKPAASANGERDDVGRAIPEQTQLPALRRWNGVDEEIFDDVVEWLNVHRHPTKIMLGIVAVAVLPRLGADDEHAAITLGDREQGVGAGLDDGAVELQRAIGGDVGGEVGSGAPEFAERHERAPDVSAAFGRLPEINRDVRIANRSREPATARKRTERAAGLILGHESRSHGNGVDIVDAGHSELTRGLPGIEMHEAAGGVDLYVHHPTKRMLNGHPARPRAAEHKGDRAPPGKHRYDGAVDTSSRDISQRKLKRPVHHVDEGKFGVVNLSGALCRAVIRR